MNHLNEERRRNRYRSILVPLDGSELSEQALPMATSLVHRHGAALNIVRVYVPIAGVYGKHTVGYDASLDRELMQDARHYLEGVVERLAAVAGFSANSALREGSVADAIAQHAVAVAADLLVMTTRGRGPIGRFWFGSVSDALVRQTTLPILFVPPRDAPPELAQAPALHRVLVPLDGSELAEQILEPALALGADAQAEYTLLRVVNQMTPPSYDPRSRRVSGMRESLLKQLLELDREEYAQAQQYLERLAGSLRTRSLIVHTRVVSNDRPANRPATAILDDASTNGFDLIALATHGQGGLKRLMVGSVADKVLRGAATPVLVYRPKDTAASAQ